MLNWTVICDVCDKEVDRIVTHEDRLWCALRVTVYCHGDQETSELSELDFMISKRVELGRAFNTKRIASDSLPSTG